MRDTITSFEKRIAMPVASPSPLVGEGITASQYMRGSVRGFDRHIRMLRQPLTRRDTHRVRVAPPSPTGGEGKMSATSDGQPA